jgi:D-alanyl-D-alanine carboxypeptidase
VTNVKFRSRSCAALSVLAVILLLTALSASAGGRTCQAACRLQRAIDQLVAAPGGPPGAIVIVQNGTHRHVLTSGVANVATGAPLRPGLHMRIASTAKAYSGAVALSLVDRGVLSLHSTVGDLLPWAPRQWRPITLAEALKHTSGLPDFSADPGFLARVQSHPDVPLPPRRLLGFITDQPLLFKPGTKYHYSNSDNIVVGLMVEAATGRSYERELARLVTQPLGLEGTTLPRGPRMPRPFIHGYARQAGGQFEDVSEIFAAGYAWASGGIVSTPADQNRFIRAYVGGTLFGGKARTGQFQFVSGNSEPPGPGRNAAGLGLFRYRTRCGTMFGHTGNTPGYTQFFAASRNGQRSAVVSVNLQITPDSSPETFRALRHIFLLAVCATNQTMP